MNKLTMSKISAVITAGGFATRLGGGPPKSLRAASGHYLLEHCIAYAAQAGIRSFIIFNNRPEFDTLIKTIAEPYGEFLIINDLHAPNTFWLAKESISYVGGEHILFLYGHAPRPCVHLTKLCSLGLRSVSASAVAHSTKNHLTTFRGMYLEPPYLIQTELLLQTTVTSWQSLMTENTSGLDILDVCGPNEVNTPMDVLPYYNYMRRLSSLHHNALRHSLRISLSP